MSDYYEVNQFDEVVPIMNGRRSNNTREYRDLTEFESQLIEEKKELEQQITEIQLLLDKANERLKTVSLPDVSSRSRIGELVMIKRDTTKFLKENNYWLEEYDLAGINNIDGMIGIIKKDYTNLKDHESHYVVALVNIDMSGIGIHPDYIMAI